MSDLGSASFDLQLSLQQKLPSVVLPLLLFFVGAPTSILRFSIPIAAPVAPPGKVLSPAPITFTAPCGLQIQFLGLAQLLNFFFLHSPPSIVFLGFPLIYQLHSAFCFP